MPLATAHRTAAAIARGFVIDAVEARLDDARRFLAEMERAIQLGIDAGADRDYLIDTAKGCHDAICNLQAAMYRDLDAAGVSQPDAYLYLGELDELINTLEADAALAKKRGL